MARSRWPPHAFNTEVDNPELKARWDTPVGDSLGIRTAKPSATLTEGPGALNFNDGDLHFAKRKRPVANRLGVFTEADSSYRGFGARLSAAGWYDAAYMGGLCALQIRKAVIVASANDDLSGYFVILNLTEVAMASLRLGDMAPFTIAGHRTPGFSLLIP